MWWAAASGRPACGAGVLGSKPCNLIAFFFFPFFSFFLGIKLFCQQLLILHFVRRGKRGKDAGFIEILPKFSCLRSQEKLP